MNPHNRAFPDRQEIIRAKCFSPAAAFEKFPHEALEGTIPERFEKIVRMYPDRIAVSTPDRELSYGALNSLANDIAQGLLTGHRTEDPVALLLEPDDAAIAAVLGVLKAKRIYVPLDSTYPRARLFSVLDHSGAGAILTDEKNMRLATELASGSRLCLRVDELRAGGSSADPAIGASPADIAAVFYTSGSTGEPKGVAQSHRGVLHRVMSDTNTFHICTEDRLSLLSSAAYSVSMRNCFGALLNGATVCPFDLSGNGLHQLESWLRSQRITIYFSVPTVFRQLVANLREAASMDSIRLLYLGGESISQDDVRSYQRHFSQAILVNSLASNEAGIIAYYFMDKDFNEFETSVVPVGYPPDGKELLILDDDGGDLAAGGMGEIAVRSRFLAPGYWSSGHRITGIAVDRDLDDFGTRVYRTGDLGYLREDGCLIHHGRKELRVKIRGARVELEEVEAALRQHHSVREAVVETFRDGTQGDRLVAYLVLREGHGPTVTELRDDLKKKLADHMIPSSFTFLTALPLTPNGKIDRQALPTPDTSRPQLKAAYAPPKTPDEVLLVQIWTKLLSVDPIGIHDNFFELGGNSLLAAMLVDRINRAFHQNLSISAVYESPTVDQLAHVLSRQHTSRAHSSLICLQPHGSKPPFFWIHGQASDGLIAKYFSPDQPVYGLIHQSMDGRAAAYTTVESIAGYYLGEIRKVQARGPYLLGGYCFGGLVAFEVAQQLEKYNEEARLLVLVDPPDCRSAALAASIRDQIHHHMEAFWASGGLRRKLGYLARWTTDAIKFVLRPPVKFIARFGRNLVIKTFVKCGKLIPVGLRSAHILDVYERAIARYSPTIYSGELVIFKAADGKRTPETWSHLVAKGVAIQVVPGNHENILREPHLGVWVERLKSQISR